MSDGNFLLCIRGQIEFVEYVFSPAGSSWHCKYEVFHGPDWKFISGLEAGLSQVSHIKNNGDNIVFNFPIEIQLKTTNPFGWPQIIMSIYKGTQLAGYARAHFPFKPGLHDLKVSLMRPQASSVLGQIASFFGYHPELLQPKMLASTDGNYLIRMEHTGQVHLSLSIVTQGFQVLGYDVGNIKNC